MNIAIIGRGDMLFRTMEAIHSGNHNIALIITAKEAPEYVFSSMDFKTFAKENNIPFIHSPNISKKEILDKIGNNFILDLGISINYTGIINQDVIDLTKLGILNMHAGDLPKYKGNAVVAWAILNGEKKIVNCIHKMVGGLLDSGDILYKEEYFLDKNTHIQSVFEWLESRSPIIFNKVIDTLDKDPRYILERQSEDINDSLRCYPRKPEDGKINWEKSASYIHSIIRVSSEPFAGAFTFYNNKKVIFWDSEIIEDGENFIAVPGQILNISDNGMTISTGDGKIQIKEVTFNNIRSAPSKFFSSIRDRFI